MIKTIKVKKQMRLDELIKYVWDNDVQNEMFRSKESDMLVSVEHGRVFSEWTIDKYETFTVEVDKEITKNTPFGWLVAVNSYGSLERYEAATITDVLSDDGADCFATKIYALIGNDLELIWEAE